MGKEKRKRQMENRAEIHEKKTKNDDTPTPAAEEPTDEEVEEFYMILRRMKQMAEYFGVERGMLAKSLSAVVAAAADQQEKKEEEEEEKKGLSMAAPSPAEVSRRGKGKEVVEENGLRLDLNIALAVQQSDGL
ncbi:hypothetical protein Csa_013196 [Cucumis sativus]|nr:hypothetical protein Csa_013196 [Cucumis sativus]